MAGSGNGYFRLRNSIFFVFFSSVFFIGCGESEKPNPFNSSPPEKTESAFSMNNCTDWISQNLSLPLKSCENKYIPIHSEFSSTIVKIISTEESHFLLREIITYTGDLNKKGPSLSQSQDKDLVTSQDLISINKKTNKVNVILKAGTISDFEIYEKKLFALYTLEKYSQNVGPASLLISSLNGKVIKNYEKIVIPEELRHSFTPEQDKSNKKDKMDYIDVGQASTLPFINKAQIEIDKKSGDLFIFSEPYFLKGVFVHRLKRGVDNNFKIDQVANVLRSQRNNSSFYTYQSSPEVFSFRRNRLEQEKTFTLTENGQFLVTYPSSIYDLSEGRKTEDVVDMCSNLKHVDVANALETKDYGLEKIDPLMFSRVRVVIIFDIKNDVKMHKVIRIGGGSYSSTHAPILTENNQMYLISNIRFPSTKSSSIYKTYIDHVDLNSGELLSSNELKVFRKGFAEFSSSSVLSEDKEYILITGRTGFRQNPQGGSINLDGYMFLSKFNLKSFETKNRYFKVSNRKDWGSTLSFDSYEKSYVLGFGLAGPSNHSGDKDITEYYQLGGLFKFDSLKF